MNSVVSILTVVFCFTMALSAQAAYHHGGDTDSELVLQAYPAIAGSKLDNCALCHSGGEYEQKPGVFISMGSCQWCHYSFGYDSSGDITSTLNDYGKDFNSNGKDLEALITIEPLDSDGDGFTNAEEITALRYPGNADDDPTKVEAPYQVFTLEELEMMVSHTQVMLMNTHKSGDFYTEYTGVTMQSLLESAEILESATGITAYAPDGWAQYHPLEEDEDPLMYHVYGVYPEADYYYDEEADEAINIINGEIIGWCDYSSESLQGLVPFIPIYVPDGLQMLLAYKRDGYYLEKGELSADNKLDGEGPFRVVPPQKIVGPPDQSVKSPYQDVIWPFDDLADHNAGFATRSATIIKVEPLPEGTTDIDVMEAGWDYVDEEKVVVYGAISPISTVLAKIEALEVTIEDIDDNDFKNRFSKQLLLHRLDKIERTLRRGKDKKALRQLTRLIGKVDGCNRDGQPDGNDAIIECTTQLPVYWAMHEMIVLLEIIQ